MKWYGILAFLILIGGLAGVVYLGMNTEKFYENKGNSIEETIQLSECSRVPRNVIECSEGFVCNESLSGGLGPPGVSIPIEHIGGDNLCRQECETNDDCPLHAPVCKFTQRQTEDYLEGFNLCFSE